MKPGPVELWYPGAHRLLLPRRRATIQRIRGGYGMRRCGPRAAGSRR